MVQVRGMRYGLANSLGLEGNGLGISRQQAEHLRIWSLPAVMLHQSPTACVRSALPHWCGSSEQASVDSQAGPACLQHSTSHSFFHAFTASPSICSLAGLLSHSFIHACMHQTYVFSKSQDWGEWLILRSFQSTASVGVVRIALL